MYPSSASAVLLFVASALFSASANAADFAVQVGQGGLKFSPDHVSGAVVGDTVTFQFLPSSHTATQGSFNTPCTHLTGGFDSGTRAGAATADAANTFQITVNSTDPLWVFCATPGHCTSGMVFAVNAASDTQLSQYQQNAATPGSFTLSTSAASSTAASSGTSHPASGTTTGGSGTTTSRSASSTTSTGAGFFNAQVVPGFLMTILAGSFGALFL